MKNRKIVSVLGMLMLSVMITYGQKITGIVYLVDEPLEGAKVLIESNNKEVKTDHNGYFSVDVKGMTEMTVRYKKMNTSMKVNEISGFVDVQLIPSEKVLARMISREPSVAKCEAFIRYYPQAKNVDLIHQTLEELTFIEAFDAAVGDSNLQLLEGYIAQFPNGKYQAKANKTLDVVSWQKARSNGSQQAYEAYMERFPNGIAVKLAKEKLAMIHE